MSQRHQAIQQVLWVVLLLNLSVTFLKISVGLASGALAVLADGFHSIVDSSSNLIGLLGVWVAARPADHNHPYGHHKYETVATLGIGGLLLVAAFEIGKSVVARLFGAESAPTITPLTLGLMALTFAVNLGIVAYEGLMGKRLQSELLLADATHTRTDLFITLSVLVSLVATQAGWGWLDPIVAGGVVILLVRAAFDILRSTSNVLTDVAIADPANITQIVQQVPGVVAVHHVRSRGRADAVYVDLNICVHATMTTDQAHGVASEVERRIAQNVPGVVDTVVHIEPDWMETAATQWEELTYKLRNVADGLGLGMHDLHAHIEHDGGYAIELHLEMPEALTLGAAHARADAFEHHARELFPKLRTITTHLEPLPADVADESNRTPPDAHTLRQRLTALADDLAGAGSCHNVELHHVEGHITATLHITQDPEIPLTLAHQLADAIEHHLQTYEPRLHRIVVHVEPPEEEVISKQ